MAPLHEELRALPWRKQGKTRASMAAESSDYMSFASIEGMEDMDESKAIGAMESLQATLQLGARIVAGVVCMPPMLVAEACSEKGCFDCPRIRRLAATVTKQRLCVGWLLLNLVTPVALYSVSSPAMAKAVLGVHVAVLLCVPAVVVGVALTDPAGWLLRDPAGYRREASSEHVLDVRPNADNLLAGFSAVLVTLQFASLQFGVPMVDPGGSPFRLPGEGGTIWGEDVDQLVSHFMHYGLDILWFLPYWSRYSDRIVSVLVWAMLSWCAAAQLTNSRSSDKEQPVRSRPLRLASSLLTGIGLFCVVVTLIRQVSRFMECPTYSGTDGLGHGYCSIVLPDDQGPSISSMLYTRPAVALMRLCGADSDEPQEASKCSCVDRVDSRTGALLSVFTMSYFTIWAVFVRAAPSIATTISAVDLDIIVPQPVQSAETLTRIVVASVVTITSPHMGRQGDKGLAVLSCVVATSGSILLCARLWTHTNVRNMNQMARTATACTAWIGACSVWATLDQSCINDHKAVALGTGCATLAAGLYVRSICCRPKTGIGVRESLLNSPVRVDDPDADEKANASTGSFRDSRPEYGMHTRSSMQRCRLFGLLVLTAFTASMIFLAWGAGHDNCLEFSTHDGENTTRRIEDLCWGKDTRNGVCSDLRQLDIPHRNVLAWQNMQCTGSGIAGDVCTLPSPACEVGWLAVSYSHQLTAGHPEYMDGRNISCESADFSTHLKPWWSKEITCKKFALEDLIWRTKAGQACAADSDGISTTMRRREWKLQLDPLHLPIAKAPCINVCSGITVAIAGTDKTTWVGSRVNRTTQPEGESGTDSVDSRLLFDVRCNGTLHLNSLRINRTSWDEDEPTDHSNDDLNPHLIVWQNAIRVRGQATAVIEYSTLRGIQIYVDPGASSFNLSHTALVPLVDRHDGGTPGKQNKAQGGAAGQYQLHPSCITVCPTRTDKHYLPSKGLCGDLAQPQGAGNGHFHVSDSILSMTYLNTPRPLPTGRSYITFSRSTFYMSSLVGGQPVTQPGHEDSKKLMFVDAMANDAGVSTPLFPISRSTLLDEDKVVSPNRQLLSARFDDCKLAGCSSMLDFCEGKPTEHEGALSTQIAPDADVFAQLNSLDSDYSLHVNVTASTPTFGDRLMFSVDVLPEMNVVILGGSNTSSGSAFFLKGMFRRKNSFNAPEMWFFRGGHLHIENLRMDYCVDQVEQDSWLPSKGDKNVGDANPSESSLTLVRTFNLYTHIFRKGQKIQSYQGGRGGMPNYDTIITLVDINIASLAGMDTCRAARAHCDPECYTDCADDECKEVLRINSVTATNSDGSATRRFLNVTQVAPPNGQADRFGSWQPEIGDQLFDFNVSWYGTYQGQRSGGTPRTDASSPVLHLGADHAGRWGVSAGCHLELHNAWLVADLQTASGQPCCRPGFKTSQCTSVPDSRCGACAPIDDGTVLKPIAAGEQSGSCTPAFASNAQPMQDVPRLWRSGTISFHTVAIQSKRVQIQTNTSCDNTLEHPCDLEPMEALPLNIMGRDTPFVLFEECELARSESATVSPKSVFAAFSLTEERLDIRLTDHSPVLLWDLRYNDSTTASDSRSASREISIVGDSPTAHWRLLLRRLLLPDGQQTVLMRDLELMLSLDPPQTYHSELPPIIHMVNVGIAPPDVNAPHHSPCGVFSGLSRWDIDTCKQERTWCSAMKDVAIMPERAGVAGSHDESATSPCIDNRDDNPVAIVNTDPDLNGFGKSRLDIVVSDDGLDVGEAVRSASNLATVTVSGGTSLMWCDGASGKNSSSSSGGDSGGGIRGGCHRLNVSAIGCTDAGDGSYTRAPSVTTSLQELQPACADKMCVLQNVSLNFTGGSLVETNRSLGSFSSCSSSSGGQQARLPQGVRFGDVALLDLCAAAETTQTRGDCRPAVDGEASEAVAVATLIEHCSGPGSTDHPGVEAMASTCDCTQLMQWKHQAGARGGNASQPQSLPQPVPVQPAGKERNVSNATTLG